MASFAQNLRLSSRAGRRVASARAARCASARGAPRRNHGGQVDDALADYVEQLGELTFNSA